MYDSYVRTESCREVARLFRDRFPDIRTPHRDTVRKLAKRPYGMRFLFMGDPKNKVYQNNPHTLEELKANIRREITAISDEELMRVNRNFLQRCERCVAAQRHHFQHLLWQRYVIVVIVNLHDKRRRLNLNFQRGSYLPLAGERRQEWWRGEARTVRPAGRATFGWAGDSEI